MNTYNPHFHIIVANKEIAQALKMEWLKLWTPKWTYKKAQFIRPAEDLDHDLMETIKYGSKIFTEPDLDKKTKVKVDRTVYASALYNILEAMQGLRIFERFGFDLPSVSEKHIPGSRIVNEYYKWKFLPQYHDWQNVENELVLTSYTPSVDLLGLLKYHIDTQLE